ncbi:MAG: hypothetical protein GAK30_03501 [Paracidovorax wautersii]|uniref:Tripartite-type tricarboxylate transporter, receptor component TctC n=1 Tax=Paracidovorax wautersii TaxID=1177982 RepID=A0A7V8JP54_9BURK|nr:MAG: hypothetical protein GAK30_03501 [Paracidovorax wautersii]
MTVLSRRHWMGATAGWTLAAPQGTAFAQSAPTGPVKIIVPYPPGAATDALARLLAQALEGAVGATFIVDNKGGGATQIGTKAVAAAAPDGQTLGFVDTAFVINPGLFGDALPYDTLRDFTPVSLMAKAPLVLVVHPSVQAQDIRAFVALAKASPGTLNYGSADMGSAPHLAGEQLARAAGIRINHIPYRGGGTVLSDLLAGHIQFGFTTVPTMLAHIRSGAMRALAVTSPSGLLAGVPTFADAGLAGVDARPLFGLVAPARTPAAVVSRLSDAAVNAVQKGPLRERLQEQGFTPLGLPAAAFQARIATEIAKWREVIRAGGIKPDA